MGKKKIIAGLVIAVLLVLANIGIMSYREPVSGNVTLAIDFKSDLNFSSSIYYLAEGQDIEDGFTATQVRTVNYGSKGLSKWETLSFNVPYNVSYIRFDPSDFATDMQVRNINLYYKDTLKIEDAVLDPVNSYDSNLIESIEETGDGQYDISTETGDSYIVMPVESGVVAAFIEQTDGPLDLVKHILLCVALDLLLLIIFLKWDFFRSFPQGIFSSKRMILNLAKNDFKSRFSGSYLGIVWAFVNPIVTVILYWFVFQMALNVGTQSTKAGISVPYVLWLLAGLVPWFYFSDAWGSGTNSLVEYSYLVKKVVFKIEALPVVKIVSSLFVHIFFIGFMVVFYIAYGFPPNGYWLQIIYYSFAMIMLATGITYLCAAIVPFFRDLSQIISISMQVLMWTTPIMWNIDSMTIHPVLDAILRLNPMYYIVNGYRDSLITGVCFWERLDLTLYFWIFTGFLIALGTAIFKKLEVHFADVL